METLFIYFAKVIVCSSAMFLYYWLLLRNKTFHHYNRFYLLLTLVVSLVLPMLKLDYFTIEVTDKWYQLLQRIEEPMSKNIVADNNVYYRIIFGSLVLVAIYLVSKVGWGIIQIQRLKVKYTKESVGEVNFYQIEEENAPFSFFKNLFWKKSIALNSEVGERIFQHEVAHIRQKHSWDKIFIELVSSIIWFNPFFHLIKKELYLIHEYLADQEAVMHKDSSALADMILTSAFATNNLPATNAFMSSSIKRRILMLKKPKSKYGYLKRILALPLVFAICFAYLVKAKNTEIKEINNLAEVQFKAVQNKGISSLQKGYKVNLTKSDGLKDSIPTNKKSKMHVNQLIREIDSLIVKKNSEIDSDPAFEQNLQKGVQVYVNGKKYEFKEGEDIIVNENVDDKNRRVSVKLTTGILNDTMAVKKIRAKVLKDLDYHKIDASHSEVYVYDRKKSFLNGTAEPMIVRGYDSENTKIKVKVNGKEIPSQDLFSQLSRDEIKSVDVTNQGEIKIIDIVTK